MGYLKLTYEIQMIGQDFSIFRNRERVLVMSKEQLTKEIEAIIMQVGTPDSPEETFSVEDFLLNMDSLKFIELVTAVENRFQITMESDEMMRFKSGNVPTIVDAVRNHMAV